MVTEYINCIISLVDINNDLFLSILWNTECGSNISFSPNWSFIFSIFLRIILNKILMTNKEIDYIIFLQLSRGLSFS